MEVKLVTDISVLLRLGACPGFLRPQILQRLFHGSRPRNKQQLPSQMLQESDCLYSRQKSLDRNLWSLHTCHKLDTQRYCSNEIQETRRRFHATTVTVKILRPFYGSRPCNNRRLPSQIPQDSDCLYGRQKRLESLQTCHKLDTQR